MFALSAGSFLVSADLENKMRRFEEALHGSLMQQDSRRKREHIFEGFYQRTDGVDWYSCAVVFESKELWSVCSVQTF